MRELIGLASVFFGRRVSGTGGECVVRCLTLIRSVPIFTVAMGGKVYFAWWTTVECGSNGAALIVLCNVSGCGFRPRDTLSDLGATSRQSYDLKARSLRPPAPIQTGRAFRNTLAATYLG